MEVGTFTYTLTNGSFVIAENDGLTRVSIYNSSATAGTVTGAKVVNGISSTALSIAEGVTVTIIAGNANSLDGITITSPNGTCDLEIIAN
jgi:hypothetical protein